jgi:hypothetical protein
MKQMAEKALHWFGQPVFVDQDGQAYDRWQVVKNVDRD